MNIVQPLQERTDLNLKVPKESEQILKLKNTTTEEMGPDENVQPT
jgi:hypothetical protein